VPGWRRGCGPNRELTAEDFPDDVPMNFDSRDRRSERLEARLAAAA
jgi:hypothetical protein